MFETEPTALYARAILLRMSDPDTNQTDPRLLVRCLDVLTEELDELRRLLLSPDDDPAEQTPESQIA